MVRRGIAAWLVALVALPLAAHVPAAAAQESPVLTATIVEDGPFAPGATATVAVTGAPPGAELYVQQCHDDWCDAPRFVVSDAAGNAELAMVVRRHLIGGDGVIDCSLLPCSIVVVHYGDDDVAFTTAPIEVDGTQEQQPREVTATPRTGLASRSTITLSGSGFEPEAWLRIAECAWLLQLRCLDSEIGWTQADPTGAFTTSMTVTRSVHGRDCAAYPDRCFLWVVPEGHMDHMGAIALQFDGSVPIQEPTVTATPSTGLLHQQAVTVSGAGFSGDGFGWIDQCTDAAPERCRYLVDVAVASDGSFVADVEVRRAVGGADCAVVGCHLVVSVPPFDEATIAIGFDPSVPPPPGPALTVEPAAGLVDRQVVDVTVEGAEPGADAYIRVCTAEGDACGPSAYRTLTSATTTIPMAVTRSLQGQDCAVVPCALLVSVFGADTFELSAPLAFDPDAPFAPPGAIVVAPNRGLWDGQRVEVRGDRLDPGTWVSARQCLGDGSPGTCAAIDQVGDASSAGELRGTFKVARSITVGGTQHDCAAVECSLVVDAAERTVHPLTFDPEGPDAGSELPRQLDCVAWPTQGWPTGELPRGVDPVAVAAAGEAMVGPWGGDSVVVIHAGRLVYENYAEGITADTILPSYSMSKSFTSTIVGLLVDEGSLDLDARAPVPAWSAPDDPRGAITLRHLLNMASGLQWDESYVAGSDVVNMVVSPDPAAYVTAKPLEATPGTRFHYSTGDTTVLARIIGDTAGVSGPTYEAFLRDRLLDPLGITPSAPAFDPTGTWHGGWKTDTTTRNFAKLGLLYLRDGVWEDEPLLSSSWVEFVRTPSPASSGYGGQFWLNGDGSFSMIGLAGQAVQIVPELDLIVAVNNGGGTGTMVDLFRGAQRPVCGQAPEAVDDAVDVAAGSTVDIDVLVNDLLGDTGLEPATLSIADAPALGAAEVVGTAIRYVADPDAAGTDELTYVVCSPDREVCVEALVTVTISGGP